MTWDKTMNEPPLPTRRWLAPDEAAAYLGVSTPTLRDLGVQPSKMLGPRTPRYDREQLDEVMNNGIAHHQSK